MIIPASARSSTGRSAAAARGRSPERPQPPSIGNEDDPVRREASQLRAPAPASLPAALAKTVPEPEKLFSRWATFSGRRAAADGRRLRESSPTNRRLDSQAQSCGLSLPTFTRERIGIMPAHRIRLPGTRHAFAGCAGPRLPIPGKRAGMRLPNGLAVWPRNFLPRRKLAMAGGCGPPSDPSACPRGAPADCRQRLTTLRNRHFLEERDDHVRPRRAAAGAPCLPAVPAAPETLAKHLTPRCLTFSRLTPGKPRSRGLAPPPAVGYHRPKERVPNGRGIHAPRRGEQGRLAQRSFRAHFRCHRSRHQQLPAPGGPGVGRRLRSHRRLFPAGPAGRGSGAERVAVRRGDRAHVACAGRLRVQDRAPQGEPRPPHRHRSLPPRLQRRRLPGHW